MRLTEEEKAKKEHLIKSQRDKEDHEHDKENGFKSPYFQQEPKTCKSNFENVDQFEVLPNNFDITLGAPNWHESRKVPKNEIDCEFNFFSNEMNPKMKSSVKTKHSLEVG